MEGRARANRKALHPRLVRALFATVAIEFQPAPASKLREGSKRLGPIL